MALADAGSTAGGGAAGLCRAGGGSDVGANRQPTSFPGMNSPSRTYWPWNQTWSVRNTSGHCCRPCVGWGSGSGGGQACRWRDPCLGTEILPDFVAPLDKGLRLLELAWVDQVSDVAWQFAEEKDRLDLTVAVCRAVRLSHMTEGLLLSQPGWSSHLPVLWMELRP
jgi:hypothetical protein